MTRSCGGMSTAKRFGWWFVETQGSGVTDAHLPAAKPPKIPRSVLVAIVAPRQQTLLIERADVPGFWQSVTGSQEEGESFAQTAERELFEETGFVAREHGGLIDLLYENAYQIYPHWRHRYPAGITHNRERCFALCLAEPLAPTLAAREHVAHQWLPIHAACDRVASWSNAAVFRAQTLQNLLVTRT
jgi:dihydroneopterin triphosphate diphosphatase